MNQRNNPVAAIRRVSLETVYLLIHILLHPYMKYMSIWCWSCCLCRKIDGITLILRRLISPSSFECIVYTVQATSTSNRIAFKCNHRHFNLCAAFIRSDVHANESAFYYFIDHIQISMTINAAFHSYFKLYDSFY